MKRALAIFCLVSTTACGPKVDLAKAVAPESVTTGWADGGAVAGKNKIVPAASFRLKNVSDQKLGPLQVNAVFRRVNDPAEWSAGYLANAASELPPGGETSTLTILGPQGYTGTDDREAMLRNPQFVDAKVELYVKSGSSNWTRIGEYPIARELLGGTNH
jgi:hypothetical protein